MTNGRRSRSLFWLSLLPILALVGCGDGADGGVGVVACDYPSFAFFHYCSEAPGMAGTQNGCVQGGGKELAMCPRENVVGTCETTLSGYTYKTYFYSGGVDARTVQAVCPGGKYTPGAPKP
jgi:hypothetical protein